MKQVAEWVAIALFLGLPLFVMLRFRLRGLLFSVFGLWVGFGILSEFFPLSRPGWEPLRNPLSFASGLACYLIPFLVIYALKQFVRLGLKQREKDEELPD